jgi:hypothetical protein
MMKQYNKYKLEDFIDDHFFIESVINPTSKSKDFWSKFQEQYPQKIKEIEKASYFIRNIGPDKMVAPNSQKEQLWLNIIFPQLITISIKESYD